MSVQRVAIIFDNTARPETTGVYCRRALAHVLQVEHFLPTHLDQVPSRGFDLYLRVDDGLTYPWPTCLRPSVWWAIDTHLDFDRCVAAAAGHDLVFAAQRDGAEQLRRAGFASASWLPLGCDPDIHRRHAVAKRFDLCFIGNLFPGPRQELLDLLRSRFPNHFVGRCYFEEMASTYSASRLGFNRSIRNDINMRVFEAVACGSLLLTNDLRDNGQEELFCDAEHLATYRSAEELLDKAAFYLEREELRERIAAAGREHALAAHTYRHRMERILQAADTETGRISRTVPSLPPGSGTTDTSPGQPEPEVSADLRDQHYFEFERPELVALVPVGARRVLDIGCGAGRMGAALKARQDVLVVGIELDERAARAARGRLDEVLIGDVERLDFPFEAGSFDAVVCGDVLEHLRDPAGLLLRLRCWLQPAGFLIGSIPNIRHHSVIRGLLQGNWTYEPAGLLDRDHLRFFTRREIEKLLYRCGFAVTSLQTIWGPGDEERRAGLPPDEVVVGRLHVAGLARSEAEEFYAYQYLVCASPALSRDHGLTSIVILTHNQIGSTRP